LEVSSGLVLAFPMPLLACTYVFRGIRGVEYLDDE
jgi:hypothetical protein